MTPTQLIAAILSPVFASTLTALLRRLFPRIDGPALVWGTVAGLSVLGNVLLAITTGHASAGQITWAVGYGMVGAVTACGAVQIHQDAGAKGATQRTIAVTSMDPTITPKPMTSDELAESVLRNLDRDTTPTSTP